MCETKDWDSNFQDKVKVNREMQRFETLILEIASVLIGIGNDFSRVDNIPSNHHIYAF